mgnify:CR=1 FL=1|jgi:hypothetical protein
MQDPAVDFMEKVLQRMASKLQTEAEQQARAAKSKMRFIKPTSTPDGRLRALQQAKVNITELAQGDVESLQEGRQQQWLANDIANRDFGRISLNLETIAHNWRRISVASYFEDHIWSPSFNSSMVYQYYAVRVTLLDQSFVYQTNSGQNCEFNHWLHSLLVAQGEWTHARWLGRFLMNFHRGHTAVTDYEECPAIVAMLELIASITEEDAWPTPEQLKPELGPYKVLIEAIDEPEAFAQALLDVMDFRMARSFGCKEVNAKRMSEKWFGTFGVQYWGLLPVELMALQALAERYLGVRPSLAVDHPWINLEMIERIPKINLDWEDDTLREVKALMHEKCGADAFSLELLPKLNTEEVRSAILAVYPNAYLPPL